MEIFTAESKVGDIVAVRSSLSRVFEKYKIDYCCGGNVTIQKACEEKGIDPEIVLNEIREQMSLGSDEKLWIKSSLSDLIDHIQSTHHTYLWEELPKLGLLVEKVVNVHGVKHPQLYKIRDIYHQMQRELEEHMRKEEDVIFPAIKRIEASHSQLDSLKQLLVELEQEHGSEGELLQELRVLSNDFIPPEDACNSYRGMLSRLEELENNLHQHVHKENSILFPRALAMQKNLKNNPSPTKTS